MPAEESMFHEALAAIDTGERARARDLLTRLLKTYPEEPTYWLWMSAAVDTPKERAYCLKETLRLDPQNETARRGLILLGELPPDPSLAVPYSLQKSNWQATLRKAAQDSAPRPSWVKLALYGAAAVALIAVLVIAAIGLSNARRVAALPYRPDYQPIAAITATATLTPTRTPLPPGPTPPWAVLDVPYTPTPLYVNTPHPRTEAYGLALRSIERADWSSALTYLQQAAAGEPDSADLLFWTGEAYRLQGDAGAALAAYEESIARDPSFAPSYLGRARARLALETDAVEDSLHDLETAARLDPAFGEVYLEWAALLIDQNEPEAALSQLDRAAETLPGSPLVPFYRAQAYLALGELARAEAEIDSALQADLTLLNGYLLRGRILQAAGRAAESLEPLEVYRLHGKQALDAEALALLGAAYEANARIDDALDAYSESLALDGRQLNLYLARGSLYLEQDDAAAALTDFNQALKLDSRLFVAQIGKARAELLAENYGQAYQTLNKAEASVDGEQDLAEVIYWRAQSLEPNNPPAAIKEWERLLTLPEESVPEDYRQTAQERITALATPTPTRTPASTPTPRAAQR